MFKNIVVAINGSACAKQAFELALRLAKVEEARIEVCSVVDPTSARWRASGNSGEQALAKAKDEAEHTLSDAVAEGRRLGLEIAGTTLFGDPAEAIVAHAIATTSDAIVMGTHGWTGIKHFVMGSVAESVLRLAPCPVIVVRDHARVPSLDEAAS